MTLTKEGSIASFYTVNKAPIKHLRVYFSPKQAGSGDPSPDNIRLISGWDGVEVWQAGKNLLGREAFKNALVNVMPVISINENVIVYSNKDAGLHDGEVVYDMFKPNTQYSFVVTASKNTNNYIHIKFQYDDGSIELLNGITPVNTKVTKVFVSKPNKTLAAIVRAADEYSNVTMYCDECGLFEGVLSLDDYEAYRGRLHAIDWSNVGSVYGGYVDLVTGELVNQWSVRTISEMGVTKTNGQGVWQHRFDIRPVWITGVGYEDTGGVYEAICSSFAPGLAESNFTFRTYAGLIDVYDDTCSSAAEFKEKYGQYQAAYPIRSELYTTYQLSPTQISTLVGFNYIWSNADRVEVEYDLAESNDELYRRRNVLLRSAPHIETITNSLANFKTDLAAPLKICKVYFEPKQDLHGYSKPWIGGAEKNLFNINAPFANPSDTTAVNTTSRTFTPGTYSVGASWSNWWQAPQVHEYSINNGSLFVKNSNVYGVGFAFKLTPGETYTISATVNNGNVHAVHYDSSGTVIDPIANQYLDIPFTVPANADITLLIFFTKNTGADGEGSTFSNIQLEKGSTATVYEPYENICPIEGTNAIELYKAGENLVPASYEAVEGKWKPTNGIISGSVYYMGQFPVPSDIIRYQAETKGITYFGLMDGPIQADEPVYDVVTITNRSGWTIDNTKGHKYALLTSNRSTIDANKVVISVGDEFKDYSEPSGITIPITFPAVGKNLFDYKSTTFIQGIRGNDGSFVEDSVSHYTENYIPVMPDTTYNISGNKLQNGGYVVRIYYSDKNKNWISKTAGDKTQSFSFTTPSNCYYIQIQTNSYNTDPSTWQLELGSTQTAYEPYGTLYGGYLDFTTGELWQDYYFVNPSLWRAYRESNGYIAYILDSFPKRSSGGPVYSNIISSFGSFNSKNMNKNIIQLPNYLALRSDIDVMTVQYGYKLAEPQLVATLSTDILKTLRGTNNIWSNTNGNIEVSYWTH